MNDKSSKTTIKDFHDIKIMTTTATPAHNIRQDLHMAPRRRLPRSNPMSAATTSSTLRNRGGTSSGGGMDESAGGRIAHHESEPFHSNQRPHLNQHPVPTYSQFIDLFDPQPSTVLSVFSPTGLAFPVGPGSNYLGEGPSGSHAVELEFVLEGGSREWEGDRYAKIEELNEEDRDSFETPRARDANDENIPLMSTPPPGGSARRPKRGLREMLSQLSLNSVGSPLDIGAPVAASSSSSDPREVALVKENLELLMEAQEHAKFMHTYFLAQSTDDADLTPYIDLCTKIGEHLDSLRATLTKRNKIGAEEWSVRSASWHQKYSKRLHSLRTTLQRLGRMRQLVENQPFRPRQRLVILTKLGQHEAKLADLASKYSTAFDRLGLRHLHFLLKQEHKKAVQQKAQRTRMSKGSFERLWKAGKTFRADLRSDFYELKQKFYDAERRDL